MPKLARAVAGTPSRCISTWAQWWPARTATPWRSRISEMSCACTPSRSKETMPPRSSPAGGPPEADRLADRRRASLELGGEVRPGDQVLCDLADHRATADERRHLLE